MMFVDKVSLDGEWVDFKELGEEGRCIKKRWYKHT